MDERAAQLAAPPPFRRFRRRNLAELCLWLRGAEIGVFLACGLAASAALGSGELPTEGAIVAAAVATLVALEVLRLSAVQGQGAPSHRPSIALCEVGVVTAAATVSLALHHAPMGALLRWDASFAISSYLALTLLRTGFAERLRRMLGGGRLAVNVAVFGNGAAAAKTIARLQTSDPRLIAVVGRYANGSDSGPAPVRGGSRTLLSDCRLRIVDAVVLAMEEEGEFRRVRQILRGCVQDIYLAAELVEFAGPGARAAALGPAPLFLLSERPLKGWTKYTKVALDQAAALLLLILLAPLIAIIAAAIKLDSPGPVLFRQLRVGYNGQLFWILKFRSMYHHEADRLAKQQTVFADPRVTRVGRLIRRLSIDELPQLINVLRGDMSLVGPRPHAPGTSVGGQRVHQLLDDYDCRHRVRPGITGLAQVRGYRGGLHTVLQASDRLESDLEYIRRASFWLDLNILFLTFFREIRSGRGL